MTAGLLPGRGERASGRAGAEARQARRIRWPVPLLGPVLLTAALSAASEPPAPDPTAEVVAALLEDRWVDARAGARAAAAAMPRDGRALALLGLAELKSGRYAVAEAWLRRALARAPQSPEAHLGLGLLSYGRTDLAAATRQLRIATRSRDLFDEAYHALRSAQLDLGDLAGAKRVLAEHRARLAAEGRELPPRLVAAGEQLALCADERVARVPVTFESTTVELAERPGSGGGRMLRARLNGRGDYELHLDTAFRGLLALSPELARELGLEQAGEFESRGVGPASPATRGAWLDSVQIGGLVMRSVPVLVIDSATYRGRASGLVGTGLLKRFDVVIDAREAALELYSRDRPGAFARRLAAARPADRVPFLVYNAPVVHVRVDGVEPLPFTLDTGASASLLDAGLFEARFRPRLPPSSLAVLSVRGSGGAQRATVWMDATLRVGDLELPGMRMIVFDMRRLNELAQRWVAGVLTGEVVWRHRTYLDFGRSQLTLERYPSP